MIILSPLYPRALGSFRRGVADALINMICELRKIGDELLNERLGRRIILGLVFLSGARIEQRCIHPRHGNRHVKAKERIFAELSRIEAAI